MQQALFSICAVLMYILLRLVAFGLAGFPRHALAEGAMKILYVCWWMIHRS